jgi:hypothetical protein
MAGNESMTTRTTGPSPALEEWLERIESLLVVLVERQTVKDWYSVEEFARLAGCGGSTPTTAPAKPPESKPMGGKTE